MPRGLLGGLARMIFGPVLLAIGTVQWSSAETRRHWPSVRGTILKSEIVMNERPNSQGNGMTTYYRAKLAYHYVVSGQSLEGEPRPYGLGPQESADRKVAQRIVARYPVGRSITEFYSPRDPNTSVLDPGERTIEGAILAFIGGTLLLCGLPMVAYQVGSRRVHLLYEWPRLRRAALCRHRLSGLQ